MRVTIECADQAEFDAKRVALLQTLAGSAVDCVVKARRPSAYDLEKPALAPRRAVLAAQNEIMDHWDARYRAMLEDIKGDIDEVLRDAAATV